MVVNIKTHAVLVEHVLPALSQTDRSVVHPEFRRVRYTSKGTYLVSFLNMNRVAEYDKNFKEIWSYDIPKPWAAIRLKNGNTLITDEADVLTREVNPKKETVWEVRKADIPDQYWYGNAQSVTRLANGNTLICSQEAAATLPWAATGRNHAGEEGRLGASGLAALRPCYSGPDP